MGWDTVNTRLATFEKINKPTANQVDQVTEIRTQQALTQGGKEVKIIASKIIRQAA